MTKDFFSKNIITNSIKDGDGYRGMTKEEATNVKRIGEARLKELGITDVKLSVVETPVGYGIHIEGEMDTDTFRTVEYEITKLVHELSE